MVSLAKSFSIAGDLCRDLLNGYPVSFKEIFNPLARTACMMIKNDARALVHDFPGVGKSFVLAALTERSSLLFLKGKSPYDYVCENPNAVSLGLAKIALREPIYDKMNDHTYL